MANDKDRLSSTEDNITLEVRLIHDTVWLTRQQMSTLFGRDVKTIGKHINNALREELSVSVIAKNATTASDGKIYNTEHFSLDMILSVGYRVHSPQGRSEQMASPAPYIPAIQSSSRQIWRSTTKQYPAIQYVQLPQRKHDRYLIVDDVVYMLGGSLKDMGKSLCGIIRTEMQPEEILTKLK